jgi:hypothetical protein
MKRLFSFVAFLTLSIAALANEGPVPAPTATVSVKATKVVNAGAVRFQFSNINADLQHKDSVLIIFDRFDHTGAGVIYRVFGADNENGIDISEIPAGKYYVTIQCLGLHHDRLEKVVSIKKQKNEKVHIDLSVSEAFSKDNVVIPVYHPKLSDLSILSSTN